MYQIEFRQIQESALSHRQWSIEFDFCVIVKKEKAVNLILSFPQSFILIINFELCV